MTLKRSYPQCPPRSRLCFSVQYMDVGSKGHIPPDHSFAVAPHYSADTLRGVCMAYAPTPHACRNVTRRISAASPQMCPEEPVWASISSFPIHRRRLIRRQPQSARHSRARLILPIVSKSAQLFFPASRWFFVIRVASTTFLAFVFVQPRPCPRSTSEPTDAR